MGWPCRLVDSIDKRHSSALFPLPGAEERMSRLIPGSAQQLSRAMYEAAARLGGVPVPFEAGDLARHHFCWAQASQQGAWLPSCSTCSPSPPRSPLHAAQPVSPLPNPTSLSPGDASFHPPPHLSLAKSPPPPGSSRSHNSILFMETNCPAGGCT